MISQHIALITIADCHSGLCNPEPTNMPEAPQNYCSYALKSLAAASALVGLILSWRAFRTCDFISFVDNDGNPPDGADAPPFNTLVAANVGIFRYEEVVDGRGKGGCTPYFDRFSEQQDYPSLATAQFCATIGSCFAFFGFFMTIVDFCACNFLGSFMFASFFLLVGAGVQAGVFTLIADPVFCFEGRLDCEQGTGVYMAATACVLYFLAACFNCVSPRSDPFCYNFGLKPEVPTKSERKNSVVIQSEVSHGESETFEESKPGYMKEKMQPPTSPKKRPPASPKKRPPTSPKKRRASSTKSEDHV